ncbi:unnamed protein product [Durusdinium trenchii]|uniref:Uncharacterized protein n=1 Tax=Durusdinium trenchii TaxID=1381693 RepID=A0ABP0IJD8_9DINO
MDLQYISANMSQAMAIQTDAEKLMRRVLTLGMPTVAALNGHTAAGGAMLALAFDKRLMTAESQSTREAGLKLCLKFPPVGVFFIPGIDLGLVYSTGMTELMKAKMPLAMWNDVLCMGKRFQSEELLKHGVVEARPPAADLFDSAMELATSLKSKGKDEKTRDTLHKIKGNLYKDAAATLGFQVQDMGYATATFSATGRPQK